MRMFRAWAYLAGFQEYKSRTDPFGKRSASLYARWTYKARYLAKLSSQKTEFCHQRAMSRSPSRSPPQFPWSTHGTPGTMTPLLARKFVAFYDSGFPYTDARVKSTRFWKAGPSDLVAFVTFQYIETNFVMHVMIELEYRMSISYFLDKCSFDY